MRRIKDTIAALLILVTGISTNANCQVNMQTGSPQINIPLYNISDANNRLATGVSLNYMGGNGIHVDDLGSSVGTGWEINSSAIVREVIGVPDDQKQRVAFPEVYIFPVTQQDYINQQQDFANYVTNYYPNGYLYSEYNAGDIITNVGAYSLTNPGLVLAPKKILADREMDVFTFDLNGRIGKFMIGKDRSVFFLNEKDAKLKVALSFDETLINQNIRTTLSGFTITDETGIQYVYNDMELTEVVNYTQPNTYSNADGSFQNALHPIVQTFSGTLWNNNEFPSLTNPCVPITSGVIIGPPSFKVLKGIKTGQFVCSKWALTRILNPLTAKSIEFSYATENITAEGGHNYTNTITSGSSNGDQCGINVTVPLISTNIKKISSIYNQYGDKIEFIYGSPRQDLMGDNALTKINFYKNGTWVSDEAFSYGYMYQSTISSFTTTFTAQQQPYIRLSLNNMQREGLNGALEPPYVFQYYTTTSSVANGNPNPYDIVPPRCTIFHDDFGYFTFNANLPVNSFGQIFAPAAGNVYPFSVYQIVNYTYNPHPLAAENGLIKSIALPSQGITTYNYEPNLISSTNNYSGVRVGSTLLNDVTTGTVSETDYNYLLADNSTSAGWGFENPVYGYSLSTTQYNCSTNSSNTSTFLMNSAISLGKQLAKGVNFGAALANQVFGFYSYVIINIIEGFFYNPPNSSSYQSTFTSNGPINYNNLLPLNYSQVTVSNKSNGVANGKTIFYFTSPSDYPLEYPGSDPLYSMKQRYGYWKYGLLKKAEIYNNTSPLPIKVTQNIYSTNTTNYHNSSSYLSQHWIPNSSKLYCQTGIFTSTDATTGTDMISTEQYYPFSGKIDLLSTTETTFDASGNNGVSQTTAYQYNADGLPSVTSQTDSKGQKFETVSTYSNDYTVGGAIAAMQQNNNIASPVLTESYVYKSPTSKKLLSGSIIGYGQISNNDIKPITTYEFRSPTANNALVDNTSLQGFNPSQIIRDPAYYQPIASFYYDINGALYQKTTESSLSKYIYDQPTSDRLIAEISNASYKAVGYTSFEDNAQGNWTYAGTSTIDNTSPTGTNCYDLGQSNGSINFQYNGLGASDIYIVSYWSKNGIYNVSGSTGTVSQGRTSNGWTYYQHTVSNTSLITISGNGYIDELRLYPKEALMNTQTYNSPLFGISSQCDANNKIIYYTYDDLGRKSTIRDQDRNIIKAFDYKFQQPMNGQQVGGQTYTVYLANQSQYPGIMTATIDGTAYLFPASGVTITLPVQLTTGSHTISLTYGPSSCYTINGISYTAQQTNPAVSIQVNSNLTIAYVNFCPPQVSSITGNLTSDATNTTACSCYGCQYTSNVYFSGTSIGVGTQLYYDAALTQPVTGKTWFRSYTNGSVAWPLNYGGATTGAAQLCQ